MGIVLINTKRIDSIVEKAIADRLRIDYVSNDQYAQMVFGATGSGIILNRDSKTKDYIEEGYEKNTTVFGIGNKIAAMCAAVKLNLVNSKGEIIGDFESYVGKVNQWQSFIEFRKMWHLISLLTGESIVYVPTFKNGPSRGKPMSMDIMPSQYVEIESGTWREPIKSYKMTIANWGVEGLPPEDVWHERIFLEVNFENGRNLRGFSPLRAARDVIEMKNKGIEIQAKTFSNPLRPGILAKKGNYDKRMVEEQKKNMETQYRQQAKNKENRGIPIFTIGEIQYTPFSDQVLKDMDILNSSREAIRELCNVWAWPAELANDPSASTYNNVREARKAAYTDRIIPDVNMFAAGLTTRIKRWMPDVSIVPDYNDIEELQEDKDRMATWLNTAWWIKGSRKQEIMGEKPDPELDQYYMPMGIMPAGEDIPTIEETEEQKRRVYE